MLEGLVAQLLNRFLGSYIDNFDPKQLNVGIWSGDVKLRNLKLRREALDKFKLPVDVSEGYLGELTLSIPWSNLAKKPVKVLIENVFLLAAPKIDQDYDEEDDKRRTQALKREKLDSSELLNRRQIELSTEDSKKNQSFADSLTTKIIDNLQITVKGIHIRYEDNLSSPGNPFAVGLTLAEFSAISTNSSWEPAFVQGLDDFTYKLATLGSLSVYWNTDTNSLAGKSTEDFISAFDELISRNKTMREHQYILKPVSGTGKITINKLKTHEKPKTNVVLFFDELAFAIDQDQYRDALRMVDTFHFFLRHQQYLKFRPRASIKKDPKAWLNFAFSTVLRGIHERNVVWTWDNMKKRRDERIKYIDLYKKKQTEKINLDESAILKKMEEDLAYEDIRFYRSLAKSELRKDNASKPAQAVKQAQGWISWAWSGSSATNYQAQEGDATVMNDQQRKELYDAIEWDEKQALADGIDAPADSVQLNISARLKAGSFTLKKSRHQKSEHIVQLLFDTFLAHFKQRPNSFLADLALEDMRLLDSTTPGTLYKEMVRLKDQDSSRSRRQSLKDTNAVEADDDEIVEPLFFASFEKNPLSKVAQSEFVARLKAMEIIYNPQCIETLLRFVKPPKSQMESISALMEVAGEAAKDFREQGRASLEFALTEHKSIAAHLDLQAPLIVVPESCTDAQAACMVLDAGKIHIESHLVEEDKIKELQAKQNQKLSTAEMQELHDLCYDRFNLRLESTQILIAPSVDRALNALRSPSDRQYHVVDRINMDFLLEISILPRNASLTLTKFRISGHLPSLSARVSDAKYKTMMRIIDVAIPKDDEEELEVTKTITKKARRSTSNKPRNRAFSNAFARQPELILSDHDNEDAIEDDDDEDDNFVTAPMNIDEKDLLYRQKIFEFRFTVGELRGSLYKADADGTDDEQLLVDIVLQQFALDFFLRQYDMQADVVLKSLIIEDKMNAESPPEFQKIVTSEQIGEEDEEPRDLVKVKYTQVKPASPEFQSVYGGVDKNVEVAMSTINVIVTQKSILTLFDFILTTFTTPGEGPQTTPVKTTSADGTITVTSDVVVDQGKIRVKVELTSIVLVLNQDGIRLATLKMSKGDVGVFITGPTMRVSAKIGDFFLRDDINSGVSGTSSFRQLISIQGEELVDFVYETFNAQTSVDYPGYDSSIYLRINSIKVNFLEEPLRKLLNFGAKFARMKALFDNARNAAMSSVQQAQQNAGQMHFDLLIRTPIVIFPKLSEATAERDVIIANLGEIFAINKFVPIDTESHSRNINKMTVGIREIALTSKFHYESYDPEELAMIEDADASFDIEMVSHESGSSRPDIQVLGHISDIKLAVTQAQYKFLMDLSRTVPAVFVADEMDQEELELEESLAPKTSKALTTSDTTVSDLEPELGKATINGAETEVYTTLDVDIKVGVLCTEIYEQDLERPVVSLTKSSLSRFSLDNTLAKFSSRSDGSSQGELNIKSFRVEDTRFSETNKFKEVIPAVQHHEGHQFNASMTMSGGKDRALVAMLTIDTPKVIFSLEHIFALQNWVFSAFESDQSSEEPVTVQSASAMDPQQPKALKEEDATQGLMSSKSLSRKTRRQSGVQGNSKASTPSEMSLSYRVNIVDPSIILVADSSNPASEAIVLRAKQVLLTQQSVMMLNVDKAGMWLTKMGKDMGHLRLLDDFSINLSLESRSSTNQKTQIIEIDIEPLILRVSLREILFAMHIAQKASQLQNTVVKELPSKASGATRKASVSQSSRRRSVGVKSTTANQSLATKIKDDRNSMPKDTVSDTFRSTVVNREELRATLDGIRLVLIGDAHELPVFDMSIQKLVVNIRDWSTEMHLDTNVRAFANVYNFGNSHWEPLIEPFDLGFHIAKSLNPERIDVNIFSRKRVEMTITTHAIAMASKAANYLNLGSEAAFSKPRGTDAPYRVLNMTGSPITIWSDGDNDADSEGRNLADGEEVAWSFLDWRTQRESLSSDQRKSRLAIKINDSTWEPINDIPVNREGDKIYVLKQKEKTSINHRLIVSVKLRADYVKYVTFRSALLFENRTKIPIEIVAVDEKGNKQSKIYKIAPDEDCAAPIRAAFEHGIKVRPDPGFHYQWSHQTLYWRELVQSPTRTLNCKPLDADSANFNFQCYSRFDKKGSLTGRYPYQTIRISPPVEVNNLLPFDFSYRIYDDNTKKDYSNFLRKGLSSPVHTVDLEHVLLLCVKLQDSVPIYQPSQFAVIHTNDPDSFVRESKIHLVDDMGLKTSLGLHFLEVPDSGGAFVVSVYAHYIMLNKTGLDIQVKSKSFLQKARAGAGQLPSGKGRTAVPYIHSYASDERKNRSLLKVGDSSWSKPQSFEAIGSVNDVLIPAPSGQEIHIGIKIDEGEGKYKLTKVVSLVPRFILKSYLDEDMHVREPRSSDILTLKSGAKLPIHFMRQVQERQLVIAVPGMDNEWSNPFNIQDIGRVYLKIQKRGEHQKLIKIEILMDGATIFIHMSREDKNWPFEIRNESKVDFVYYQGNPNADDEGQRAAYKPHRYKVPARCTMPYSWDYPAAKQHSLVLCPWSSDAKRPRHLRLDEIGSLEPFRIPSNPQRPGSSSGVVDLNIVADGPLRKLIIRDYNPSTSLYRPKNSADPRQRLLRQDSTASTRSSLDFETKISSKDTQVTMKATLRLEGIGLSLINSRHQELAYLSLRNIELSYSDSPAELTYDILCKWIQIDNQLYGGFYPILLYPTVVPKTGKELDLRPAFRSTLTQAKDDSHGVFFVKYATVLLQEMTMEVDEDFLFALIDFTKIPGASWSEQHEGVLCDETLEIPDPVGAIAGADAYFEVLHLQPLQLNLSFVRTERVNVEDKTSSRNPLMFFFNVLTMAIGNINDAPVKLNALLMENVLTSYPLLINSVTTHYGQEFFYQVHKILGSADFLGNPVGLFTNISSGVADIFYEPYQGFIMSDRPQEFGFGIAKGTASFVKKTVFGFSDSISKVTGSVSKGLSVATMDKQFQDSRRIARSRNRPKHALYGVQQGGMALISSLGSGVEGLARQPFEGAEREGAAGFFKGVGKGLLGLATKPVIGVFDLASNVSEGIRNTTTVFDDTGLEKVRLARHVGKDGIVRPFDPTEALGLFWLRQLPNSKLSKEDYLAHYNVTDAASLIITYQSIILVKLKGFDIEWDVAFTDLKTIALEKTGIQLILKGVRGPFIPIEEESGRRFVYAKIRIAVENYNSSS